MLPPIYKKRKFLKVNFYSWDPQNIPTFPPFHLPIKIPQFPKLPLYNRSTTTPYSLNFSQTSFFSFFISFPHLLSHTNEITPFLLTKLSNFFSFFLQSTTTTTPIHQISQTKQETQPETPPFFPNFPLSLLFLVLPFLGFCDGFKR